MRFGIIGTGWPAFQHARAMSQVPGSELAAACDIDPVRRSDFLAAFPSAKSYESSEDLLQDPSLEAVIICLPNYLHFPASLAALRAGKHVLCEKPPTLNVAEMLAVRDEAKLHGLTYAFGRQFRFESSMLAARRMIASGALGRIYFAKAQWLRLRGTPYGVGGWFTDKTKAGGGAIIDLGVHSLDAVWYLAGCPRLLSVTAQSGAYFLPGSNGNTVEDTGFAFLRFEGGLTVSLEIAWSMNMSDVGAAVVEWTGIEAANTMLHGDRAALQIEPPMVFSVDSGGGKTLVKTPLAREVDAYEGLPWPIPAFSRQLEDFSRAVSTGSPPTNHAEQAVELMKMLDGIYESSATEREVRFD
jgi:predicted dehydrogenase